MKLDRSKYSPYAGRANSLFELHQIEKALADIDNAAYHMPDDFFTRTLQIRLYEQSGRLEKSLKLTTKLIEEYPDSTNLYLIRSHCYFLLKKYPKALTDINICFKAKKKDKKLETYVRSERALILSELGQYEKAIHEFDLALKKMNKYADAIQMAYAYNNRGYTKHKFGMNEEALEDIDHSISLLPGNSYAYRNRGLVYLDMNRIDDACFEFRTALDSGYAKEYGNDVNLKIKEVCE